MKIENLGQETKRFFFTTCELVKKRARPTNQPSPKSYFMKLYKQPHNNSTTGL